MTVRLRRLGTEWAYGERLTSTDLNDTFAELDDILVQAWQKNEVMYHVKITWGISTSDSVSSSWFPDMTVEYNYDPAEWDRMILKMDVNGTQGQASPSTNWSNYTFTLLGNTYKGSASPDYSRFYWDYPFYTFATMPDAPQTIHLANGDPPWSIARDEDHFYMSFIATLYAAKTTDIKTSPDVAKYYGINNHGAPVAPTDPSWQDYTLGDTVSGPYSSNSNSSNYYTSVHAMVGFDLSSITLEEVTRSIILWVSATHTDGSGRANTNTHRIWNASTQSWETIGQYRTSSGDESTVQLTKCGYKIDVENLEDYLEDGYVYLDLQTKSKLGGTPSINISEAGILAWHRPRW